MTLPTPPPSAGTSPIPHEQIRELITTFPNSQSRLGNRLVADYTVEPFNQTLKRTLLRRLAHRVRPRPPRHHPRRRRGSRRLLSMSFAAGTLFRPRLDEFITARHELLERHTPTGRFWDWPGDTEILIATRR